MCVEFLRQRNKKCAVAAHQMYVFLDYNCWYSGVMNC